MQETPTIRKRRRKVLILALYSQQRERCYLCGRRLRPLSGLRARRSDRFWPDRVSVDHIHPGSDGGSDWPPNVALAHRQCNIHKDDRQPFACEVLFGHVMQDIFQRIGVQY